MKYYGYQKCSTCLKAKKHLLKRKMSFEEYNITLSPPSKSELKAILKSGQYTISQLFNRSGQMYREMRMKDKIDTLSQEDLLDLLVKNGKLVKRPIVIDQGNSTVGYDQSKFDKTW